MLSPFSCAAGCRGFYVLSGCLGKLRQAAALLIDKGEVLSTSAVGVKHRKRLLDIRVDLPSSKDLVVLAALDDKLAHIVGNSQVQSLLQLACWGSAYRVWLQAHSATLLLASVMRDAKCTRHVERSLVS